MDIKVNKRTLVVFDLDDTLYKEIDYLKSAYQSIARELDENNWRSLYAYMLSLFRSRLDVFGALEKEYETNKSDLLRQYRHHIPQIELLEGIPTLIDKIKKNQGSLGILTDGREITQMNKINALGLGTIVDKIVISESIGSEKPDHKNYQLFEKAFPEYTYYYIADNLKKDFVTPNARGWETIGLIDNGLNMHFDIHKYFEAALKPKHFITQFEECQII